MNRLKFLVVAFAITVSALGIYSCAKDDSKGEQNVQFSTENRNALPTVINGMLHFDTYLDFQAYITNLEQLQNDTNQIKTAFTELGVDLTQEFLPNLTDYPVALRKEQLIIGFTSARKAEETVINNALNNGDNSMFSIIFDPYLKSALNTDNAVHIGTRIFRFFNNGGVAIVLNNDWSTYNTIKTLPYLEINPAPNIYITNQVTELWSDIYNLDVNGNPISEKPFTNPEFVLQNDISPCDHYPNFLTVVTLDNGEIRFTVNYKFSKYKWTFGDGTVLFGKTVQKKITTSGMVNIIIYNADGTILCEFNFWYDPCGERKQKPGKYEKDNAGGSGKWIRIEALIWVKAGEIGCSSKLFGKNIFGLVLPLNWLHTTNGVCVDIKGNIKREVISGNVQQCNVVPIPLTTKCLQNGQSNASIEQKLPQQGNIFREANKLSSGHKARLKDKGNWFGFGVDVSRLILD